MLKAVYLICPFTLLFIVGKWSNNNHRTFDGADDLSLTISSIDSE